MTNPILDIPRWIHTIPYEWEGEHLQTPGCYCPQDEAKNFGLPTDFKGKSVIDVGANDGGFSFFAEAHGAGHVVATDVGSYELYDTGQGAASEVIRSIKAQPDKCAGFRVMREVRKSHIGLITGQEASVYNLAPPLRADYVFAFGLLYHLLDPMRALESLWKLTGECLFLETEIYPGDTPVAYFSEKEYKRSASNWWIPTVPCLFAMLRTAGFRQIREAPLRLHTPSRCAVIAYKGHGPEAGAIRND